MTDEPNNVVDIRPDMRLPERLSPDEALGYIRTLIEPLSPESPRRIVDMTLDGIREIIRKSIG